MAIKLTAKEKAAIAETKGLAEQEVQEAENREMARQLLFEYEKAPYYLMSQALESGSISHAWLFQGPKGSMKKEAAELFAQRILAGASFETEAQLSDEQQNIIRRTAHREYSSFVFLDGRRKEAISKDDIDEIQSRFAQTAAEGNGRRVYIIDHFENASVGAMNSILKFLEEPGEEIYAILTCDNTERILATILSRCISVSFMALPSSVFEEAARNDGLDEEDVYFLSHLSVSVQGLGDMAASSTYQTAKEMLKQYIGAGRPADMLYVDYETLYRSKSTENVKNSEARDSNLDLLNAFFTMAIQYEKDVLERACRGPEWYQSSIQNNHHSNEETIRRLKLLTEQRDKVNRTNDLSLLMAQTLYKLDYEG